MTDVAGIDRGYPGKDRPGQADGHAGRRPSEAGIAALAARQHGVATRRQLLALGFSRHAIDRWIASGRLHPIYRGVYAVGHANLSRRGRWMAAVLACGDEAVLSHRSAGALWDIAPTSSPLTDVTVPRGRSGHRRIRLHQVRRLTDDDRTVHDAIPVTSVARTLFDLAEVFDARRLERALERAERLQLFDLRAIEGQIERGRGRRALKRIVPVLGASHPAPQTRSELERDFLDLCRSTDLPAPQVNVIVEGYEVDALWPDQRLIVELDSFEYHRTRAAFERDRARDTALQLAGHRVLRITWRRLRDEPGAVATAIRTLLANRASVANPRSAA